MAVAGGADAGDEAGAVGDGVGMFDDGGEGVVGAVVGGRWGGEGAVLPAVEEGFYGWIGWVGHSISLLCLVVKFILATVG